VGSQVGGYGDGPALASPGCVLGGECGGECGGEVPRAAEEPGQGDRVHVVVIADDLAVSDPDDAEGGEPELGGPRPDPAPRASPSVSLQ
jgi:hypothetical protein